MINLLLSVLIVAVMIGFVIGWQFWARYCVYKFGHYTAYILGMAPIWIIAVFFFYLSLEGVIK